MTGELLTKDIEGYDSYDKGYGMITSRMAHKHQISSNKT